MTQAEAIEPMKGMHVAFVHWGKKEFHATWVVLELSVALESESLEQHQETIREQAMRSYESSERKTAGRTGKEYQVHYITAMTTAGPIRL